jgi:hypothetical protein
VIQSNYSIRLLEIREDQLGDRLVNIQLTQINLDILTLVSNTIDPVTATVKMT